MQVKTHLAFGLALPLAIHYVHPLEDWVFVAVAGLFGSLLPDIDHPRSWLGQRLPWLSKPIAKVFGHRGITHSLFAVSLMVAAALAAIYWLPAWEGPAGIRIPFPALVLGLAVGYLSHLLADWLTPNGIPLCWPWRYRFAAPLTIRTGSPLETFLMLLLWSANGHALLWFNGYRFGA
jgi:inner membrane protein